MWFHPCSGGASAAKRRKAPADTEWDITQSYILEDAVRGLPTFDWMKPMCGVRPAEARVLAARDDEWTDEQRRRYR